MIPTISKSKLKDNLAKMTSDAEDLILRLTTEATGEGSNFGGSKGVSRFHSIRNNALK